LNASKGVLVIQERLDMFFKTGDDDGIGEEVLVAGRGAVFEVLAGAALLAVGAVAGQRSQPMLSPKVCERMARSWPWRCPVVDFKMAGIAGTHGIDRSIGFQAEPLCRSCFRRD
jgi:hypothetical protein